MSMVGWLECKNVSGDSRLNISHRPITSMTYQVNVKTEHILILEIN